MHPHLRHSAPDSGAVRDGGQALQEEEEIVRAGVITVSSVVRDSKVLHSSLIVPGKTAGVIISSSGFFISIV